MVSIEREHPEYVARAEMWKTYRDLYAGGERLRGNAAAYLVQRHKEPHNVYSERLNRVFYENYVGSIIDWYAATLMRREPVILFEGHDEAARGFFNEFAEDCDRKGTNFSEFMRQRFVETLVLGSSYIVVDFPKAHGPVLNRAQEDATGRSRAYLMEYAADEVINWSYDREGGLEWVVMRTSNLRPGKAEDSGWERETRWIYYDRERYRIYAKGEKEKEPALIDEGRHGFASLRRTPVFELRVTEGLWLMNKAALLQLEHFNKSNALAWALTMGLFATPVIYSDKGFNQIVGESYYIQLGKDDKFGWTEPAGNVYQIAADNLVRLKDEIYRVCYLMHQAGGLELGHVRQSGASKQRDFSVTQEVLRAYGDAVKESMKQVLRGISAARQDGISVDVSGLDEFDIGDFSTELEDAERLLRLGMKSPTLRKQVFKKVALKYLCDARQEIKERIASEIESAE
ncbi:MAG: hypothetical protein ACE15B_19895 [Bryobacteraceae bacterium]